VHIADLQGASKAEPYGELNVKNSVALCTPPRKQYHDFAKDNAVRVYMDIPREETIYDMWSKLAKYQSIPKEDIAEQLKFYEPIPRLVFDE
jgi:hypothetical protein